MRMLIIAVAALSMLSGAARAVDFDTRITEIDGNVPVDDKGQPIVLTVGRVCINALIQAQPGDENEEGEKKIARAVLAERIYKKDSVQLTSEEIAMIKRRVNRGNQSPLIVRQTWEALERK